MTSPLVALRGVGRAFAAGARTFQALADVDLDLRPGELVALVGASGSGKSTLLGLLAATDRASLGTVRIGGVDVGALGESDLAVFRRGHVGIVFQSFHLLPTLTAAENVMLPLDLAGRTTAAAARTRALGLLDRLGVADQADKLPGALSGGQQQRVAIARALANDPPVLVADEPTGNLDSATAKEILALFVELAKEGKTVVVATHERDAAAWADRVVTLRDGRIVGDARGAA